MIRILLAFALLAAVTSVAGEPMRRDAVFILGEDKAGEGSYFEPASRYYAERMRPDVDLFVVGARSLQSVREWLYRSQRDSDPPWGRIFLVAHGSPWIGLDVPLYNDGLPTDLPELEGAIERGEFPPLPPTRFDAQTRLIIESCGVGRRQDLLDAYARLLGGDGVDRHAVMASENWIEFGQSIDPLGRAESWREERRFAAQVFPQAELDAAQIEHARNELSLRLSLDDRSVSSAPTGTWRVSPIHVELPIADQAACRSDRVIRQLRTHSSLTDRLRAYGLRAGDLAWRVDYMASGCLLIGQGTLVVLGQGQLSGEILP